MAEFWGGRLSLVALAQEEFPVGVVNDHGVVIDQGPGTEHPDRAGRNEVAADRLLGKLHLSKHQWAPSWRVLDDDRAVKPGVGGAGSVGPAWRQPELLDHARPEVCGTCARVERHREPVGPERQVNGGPHLCQLQTLRGKSFGVGFDGHRTGERCALCQ